ncbi:hypothetical protein LTR96_011770, partial [Exophiala xenobiotica]
VARKKFVDDFSNFAVEVSFLKPITTIFSSQVVDTLQDSVIEDIAAEDESSRLERQLLEEKVAALRKLLEHLRRLDRHHLSGSIVQTNLLRQRLTLLTDERNIEEQLPRRPFTKLDHDSDTDTPSDQEQPPTHPEASITTNGDFRELDLPKEEELAMSPVEDLDGNPPPKKVKNKKKHPSAALWE